MLGASEQATANVVAKLEKLAGYPGEDNRLLSEIRSSLRTKLAELGLDPNDSTPTELYHTLLSHFEADSRHFDKLIGGALNNIVYLVKLTDAPRQAWVLKRSVAKDLLRDHPPKKLARALNYRSTESMLKREDIDVLYAAFPYVESPSWLKSFYRSHGNLQPSDFEIRDIRLAVMPEGGWLVKSKAAVSYSPCAGVVAVWPDACKGLSTLLGVYLCCLEAIEQVRLNQLTLMAGQVRQDFGRQVALSLEDGLKPAARIASYPLSWRSLHHHFGHLPRSLHPMLEELHMQEASVHKISHGKVLSSLHPIFRWWQTAEHAAALGSGQPVSLNIADVAQNHYLKAPYHKRHSQYVRQSLTDELFSRYLNYAGVEAFVLNQIDKHSDDLSAVLRQRRYAAQVQKEFQLA